MFWYNRIWINLQPLFKLCTRDHVHVRLKGKVKHEGAWVCRTKLASAYPWELVWAFADIADADVPAPTRLEDNARGSSSLKVANLNDESVGPEGRLLIGDQLAEYWHVDDGLVMGVNPIAVGERLQEACRHVQSKGFVVGEVQQPGEVDVFVGLLPN